MVQGPVDVFQAPEAVRQLHGDCRTPITTVRVSASPAMRWARGGDTEHGSHTVGQAQGRHDAGCGGSGRKPPFVGCLPVPPSDVADRSFDSGLIPSMRAREETRRNAIKTLIATLAIVDLGPPPGRRAAHGCDQHEEVFSPTAAGRGRPLDDCR